MGEGAKRGAPPKLFWPDGVSRKEGKTFGLLAMTSCGKESHVAVAEARVSRDARE